MAYESSGMLNEHEAPNSLENHNSDYSPSPEEIKAIKMVNKLFSRAKNHRKSYDEKWQDNYRMFRGKQWKDARPSYRHSEVINLIFRAIQSEIPILTDALPKPEFLPREPNDFELSKILNDVLDCDWTSGNWSYNFTETLYDAHLYGTGFGGLDYDPDLNDGVGGICFKSEDPFYQFPDPYSLNVNERSRYYIKAEPVDVEVLKQKYPDHAEYIKADLLDIMKREKGLGDNVKYRSPTDNRTIIEGSTAYDLEGNNEALEVTCYVKDMETEEEEVRGEMGPDGIQAASTYIQKLKYPLGRILVVINGVLVKDAPITEDNGKFPFIRLTNYILPREFWGMSEVEQLESPQKIFNKLLSFTLDVLTLMGNPIWVVDNTSGVDTDNLFNRPGLIVEKEPGSEVRREEGVQLQPYVLQMIDRMKMWFDDISGSGEVSRGIRPEGVTAASAIEALQSAQQTRLRQKSRYIDSFMQEFGQMYLSKVFEYYDVPRVFRITNDKNASKYFKFHVEKQQDPITGEEQRVAKVREYTQDANGQYFEGQEKQLSAQKMFDVKISMGSALPFEKNRLEDQSFKLFQAGIIDAEEVLKNMRYPNMEAVMLRMQQKADAQAQAEMMAQAPQPEPQPL